MNLCFCRFLLKDPCINYHTGFSGAFEMQSCLQCETGVRCPLGNSAATPDPAEEVPLVLTEDY